MISCASRYIIVDWERSNFSISQCLFGDNMQQNLVSIKSIADSANSTTTEPTKAGGSSGSGKTVGIIVAMVVVVVVLAVCGIVLWYIIKRKRRQRQAEQAERNKQPDIDPAEDVRQGFAKAELDTDLDHARYEMAGPDAVEQKLEASSAEWVKEKAEHPGDRSLLAEAPGENVNVPELASRRIMLRPLHEMYDPSTSAVELPADTPWELPGSPPPLSPSNSTLLSPTTRSQAQSPGDRSISSSRFSRSSDQSSSIHRQLNRSLPPRSSSRHQDSATPGPSGSSRGVSSPSRSGTSSPRAHEMFSPISPIGDEESGPSSIRGLRQPTSSGMQSLTSRYATGNRTQDTSDMISQNPDRIAR